MNNAFPLCKYAKLTEENYFQEKYNTGEKLLRGPNTSYLLRCFTLVIKICSRLGYNVLIRICYVTQHLAIHDNKQCYVHEFK